MAKRNVDVVIRGRDRASRIFGQVEGSSRRLSRAFFNLRTAAVGALGGLSLVRLARKTMSAFATQEEAVGGLGDALRSTGQDADKLLPQLEAAAARFQRLTVYGDEFVMGLMTQAVNLGATGDQIELYTRQSIGLAKALRMDVATATRYVTLAHQGEFTMLRRYIPALRSTTDATEQLAIIQRAAAAGFAQARGEALRLGGSAKRLGARFGDLLEQVGERMGPAFARWIESAISLTEILGELSDEEVAALIDTAKTLGKVLLGIWLAPKLIAGVRGFIGLLGGVRTALIATKVASAGVATAATALAAGPLVILAAGFAYAAATAAKAKARMVALRVEAKTFFRMLQGVKGAQKELGDATTAAGRKAALEALIAARRRLMKHEEETARDEDIEPHLREEAAGRVQWIKRRIAAEKKLLKQATAEAAADAVKAAKKQAADAARAKADAETKALRGLQRRLAEIRARGIRDATKRDLALIDLRYKAEFERAAGNEAKLALLRQMKAEEVRQAIRRSAEKAKKKTSTGGREIVRASAGAAFESRFLTRLPGRGADAARATANNTARAAKATEAVKRDTGDIARGIEALGNRPALHLAVASLN